MFKIHFTLNPFFQTDDSNGGKTPEEIAAEQAAATPGKTDEPKNAMDEEYEKLLAETEASRQTILNPEEVEPGKSTEAKTPEEIEAASKAALEKFADEKTIVNDDFINNVEKTAEYFGFSKLDKSKVVEALKSFKGKELDNSVLKSFVHTQVTLQNYKEKENSGKTHDNPTVDDIFDTNKRDIEEQPTNSKYSDSVLNTKGLTDQEAADLHSAKNTAIYNLLKPKFKDLTIEDLESEDTLNDYIATVATNKPLVADDFKDAYRKANRKMNLEVNEYVDKVQNWRSMMKADAEAEIQRFGTSLKEKGLTLEQLEAIVDENFVINTILKDSNGKIRTDIVKNYKNDAAIFELDKSKFYEALTSYFEPRVTELVKRLGANNAFTKKQLKTDGPSQAGSSYSGSPLKPEDSYAKGVIPDDSMDYEEMQKTLEKNRKQILDKTGNPY